MNGAGTPKADGGPRRAPRRKGSSCCCKSANERWLEPDARRDTILLEVTSASGQQHWVQGHGCFRASLPAH